MTIQTIEGRRREGEIQGKEVRRTVGEDLTVKLELRNGGKGLKIMRIAWKGRNGEISEEVGGLWQPAMKEGGDKCRSGGRRTRGREENPRA